MKKQKKLLFDDKNSFHFYYVWSVKNPKAWVHIIHGMSEHAARYDELASELNKEDIFVTAGDHRGHGCLLYTSPSPRDLAQSRIPSYA